MKRITSCRVCESPNIVKFIDLGKQPYANSLLKSPDEKEAFYPLSLSWCADCNLIQLNHTADPKELFSNYVWVTATSRTAREHAKTFYTEVLSHKNLKDGYVLEIASNDGTFLIPFIQNNYKVLGIDPAQNIVDIAIANGVPTKCSFFGVEAAEEIIKEYGHAQVVIARNVLPHVANLHDFFKGLHTSLDDDGLLVIEAHYAKRIYEELHYDSIYHEHLCYFTLKSVEKLLNKFNLFVVDIKVSPISGGSFILYIKKKKKGELPIVQSYRDTESKIGLNKLSNWQSWAEHVKSHREEILKILTDIIGKTGPIVGYGASARSSTLLNYCGIDTRFVSIIADQNSLKHKHYTAGTHIPIDSPENVLKKNPKYVFILAWNFADEIITGLKKRFDYAGKCIIPLPNNSKIVDVTK